MVGHLTLALKTIFRYVHVEGCIYKAKKSIHNMCTVCIHVCTGMYICMYCTFMYCMYTCMEKYILYIHMYVCMCMYRYVCKNC